MAGETNVARDLSVVPDFQNVDEHFRMIREEAGLLAAQLTDTQFNWRSNPDTWSIAQCLDHLNVAGYLLLPRLEEAIQRARALNRRNGPSGNIGFIGRWFVKGVTPIPARKMKAPRLYNPSTMWAAVDEVLPRFEKLQDDLVELAVEAQAYDVDSIKLASPVSSLLRMNIPAWLISTAAHEQRHLLQARAIRDTDGFPEA